MGKAGTKKIKGKGSESESDTQQQQPQAPYYANDDERKDHIQILIRLGKEIGSKLRASAGVGSSKDTAVDSEFYTTVVKSLEKRPANSELVSRETLQQLVDFVSKYRESGGEHVLTLSVLKTIAMLSLLGRNAKCAQLLHECKASECVMELLLDRKEEKFLVKGKSHILGYFVNTATHHAQLKDFKKYMHSKLSDMTRVTSACYQAALETGDDKKEATEGAEGDEEEEGLADPAAMIYNFLGMLINLTTTTEMEKDVKNMLSAGVFEVVALILDKANNAQLRQRALNFLEVVTQAKACKVSKLKQYDLIDKIVAMAISAQDEMTTVQCLSCISNICVKDKKFGETFLANEELLEKVGSVICSSPTSGSSSSKKVLKKVSKKETKQNPKQQQETIFRFIAYRALINMMQCDKPVAVQKLLEMGIAETLVKDLKSDIPDLRYAAAVGCVNLLNQASDENVRAVCSQLLDLKSLDILTDMCMNKADERVIGPAVSCINSLVTKATKDGDAANVQKIAKVVEKREDLKQILKHLDYLENSKKGAPLKTVLIWVLVLVAFLLLAPLAFKYLKAAKQQ